MENYKSPEQKSDGLTADQRELAEYYLTLYKEEDVSEQERRDCGTEIVKLQNMFVTFEENYSIDELNAILTEDEALNNPARELAKEALIPIVAELNILKKETNITDEKYDELNNQYWRLSSAVGIINSHKVRH